MSRPNVADWQYPGVDIFTLGLEWTCGRESRKGHICEDTFSYGSYSSKDICEAKRIILLPGLSMLMPKQIDTSSPAVGNLRMQSSSNLE